MNSTALYKRTEVIGRGKFGVVYKGYNKQTNQVVAIKVLNLDTEEDEVIDVQQEIQFLTELKNVPNVTHYYGSILHDTKLWIIMDYCAGGSLRTLLKAGVLEEKYIGIIVRELLIALSGVHKMGVIHRDLKAANVLITKEGNVQLCDFGVATRMSVNSKRTTMAGTPYWMAPEVIRTGDSYDSKADIWSLGITIYEIATGNPPYCDKDALWAMQMISKLTPPRLEGREFSVALKECIALCLDENPEERPSADDLFKCKLVKTYKMFPKQLLKEVVSRYLLWRDRNSARDSVFINLEDDGDLEIAEDASDNQSIVDERTAHNHQIQVKWDFDSLSSREYIIENNIDLDHVEDSYNKSYDSQGEIYTLPTLKAESTVGRNQSTFALNNLQNSTTTLNTMSKTEIPKSLQLLFEDESDKGDVTDLPAPISVNTRMESPTIEIPDMDDLSNFPTTSTPHPPLNKPPTLYHSQSASASLESRYSSSVNTSPNETRARKKTISNTIASTASSLQTLQAGTHTPPYTTPNSFRTPSPKPPPSTSGLLNSNTLTNKTNSPSKMKPLQSNLNPLLQPINFKLGNEGSSKPESQNPTLPQQPPPLLSQQSMPAIPVATTITSQNSTTNLKAKRNRPGFHIQMPTPSNTIQSLAALTNEPDNENVNQFGINPAQAAAMSISMTPVTEKELIPSLTSSTNQTEDGDEEKPQMVPMTRERADSVPVAVSVQRPHQNSILAQKKTGVTVPHPMPQTAPAVPNPAGPNLFLPRGNSTLGSISTAGSGTAPSTTSSVTTPMGVGSTGGSGIVAQGKFPAIPQINNEFFIDAKSNLRLVNELESMIKLFNQGLEALEESL